MIEAKLDFAKILAESKRTKKAVPDGEHRGVVGIGLFVISGMMDFVHVGGDKDDPQQAVEGGCQSDVGVLELYHRKHQC